MISIPDYEFDIDLDLDHYLYTLSHSIIQDMSDYDCEPLGSYFDPNLQIHLDTDVEFNLDFYLNSNLFFKKLSRPYLDLTVNYT